METHEIVGQRTVYFEESDASRTVVRDCRVCFAHAEVYGSAVVSPSGLAHIAENETTLCGKDATGEDWWWAL